MAILFCLFCHENSDQERDLEVQELFSRQLFKHEDYVQLGVYHSNLDLDSDADHEKADESEACSNCSLTSIMQNLNLNLYDDGQKENGLI